MVEVDEETGAVRITRYGVVDDVGRMITPMLVKGQIHGGIVQGLGQGLAEVLAYVYRLDPRRTRRWREAS